VGRAIAIFLFATLVVVPPVSADTLLCMSDSKGLEGSTNSPPDDWCALVAAAHGFGNRYCRSAVAGRTAVGGLAAIPIAMALCASGGRVVDDVLIDYSANDVKTSPQPTAEATAAVLRSIAAYVEANGARAHIVTPPPILNYTLWPAGSNAYVGRVAAELYRLDGVGPDYIEAPVRDKFTEASWLACAPDGVHPQLLPCREKYRDAISDTW